MVIWQNENRDSTRPRPLCLCSIGTVQDQYKYTVKSIGTVQDQYKVDSIGPTLYLISPPALAQDPGALHH